MARRLTCPNATRASQLTSTGPTRPSAAGSRAAVSSSPPSPRRPPSSSPFSPSTFFPCTSTHHSLRFPASRTSRARRLIADNYWKLRDQAYSAWDESMLKHYLDTNKVEYKADAKRKDLVELVKEYCASPDPAPRSDFWGPLIQNAGLTVRDMPVTCRLRRAVVPLGHVVGRRAARVGRQGEARLCGRRRGAAPPRARAARERQLWQGARHGRRGVERGQHEGLAGQAWRHQERRAEEEGGGASLGSPARCPWNDSTRAAC